MTAPDGEGPPVVELPEPLGRRLRLGPFPSARDALKFATCAAVGAVVAAFAGAVFWVPFLGGGFLLAVYRHDGKSLDERAGDVCAYRLRSLGLPGRSAGSKGCAPRGGVARLESGVWVAVLAAGGIPVAFLPPDEARRLFEGYVRLLTAAGDGIGLHATTEPLEAAPFRPAPGTPGAPDLPARDGYREMVTLLCRRRSTRRVLVLVFEPGRGPNREAVERLEGRAELIAGELGRLGIVATRLKDRALDAALVRVGWTREPTR